MAMPTSINSESSPARSNVHPTCLWNGTEFIASRLRRNLLVAPSDVRPEYEPFTGDKTTAVGLEIEWFEGMSTEWKDRAMRNAINIDSVFKPDWTQLLWRSFIKKSEQICEGVGHELEIQEQANESPLDAEGRFTVSLGFTAAKRGLTKSDTKVSLIDIPLRVISVPTSTVYHVPAGTMHPLARAKELHEDGEEKRVVLVDWEHARGNETLLGLMKDEISAYVSSEAD